MRGYLLGFGLGCAVIGLMISIAMLVAPERPPDRDREIDRACTLAGGSVRSILPWLAPGHPRREAGLLLLGRDAAWAPVCARDGGAGAELRSRIDDVLGQPDAPGALPLATQLLDVLETRYR